MVSTKKSMLTPGLVLESLIARALEDDSHVALASLDLSAAFDLSPSFGLSFHWTQ